MKPYEVSPFKRIFMVLFIILTFESVVKNLKRNPLNESY